MSMWTLVLFATVCFGISFALAHLTERLLLSVVDSAGRRRESNRSGRMIHQDVAIADAGADAANSGNEANPANAATSSGNRQDGPTGSPDSERPQARVHRLHRTVTARGFRTSSRLGLHSREPSDRESGATRQPTESGAESHRPLPDPQI
jgi:hypothetical protein